MDEISKLLTYLAEITTTRRRALPLMIASIALVPFSTTASPAKSLQPVLKELCFIAFHLGLEFALMVIGFGDNDVAPSHILRVFLLVIGGSGPGD